MESGAATYTHNLVYTRPLSIVYAMRDRYAVVSIIIDEFIAAA